MRHDASVDVAHVAERTEGFSGADLQALMYNAQLLAVHDVLDSHTEGTGSPTVCMEHVEKALTDTRGSLGGAERRRLDAVYAEFSGQRDVHRNEGDAGAATAEWRKIAGKKATLA